MRDDRQRLLDMLEAIDKIDRYVNAESGFHPSPDEELRSN